MFFLESPCFLYDLANVGNLISGCSAFSKVLHIPLRMGMCKCICQVALVVSNCLQPYGLVAHQAPLSMGFFKQECWSGLPCPIPGDLPNPGTEPTSLISNLHCQAGSLPLAPSGKPMCTHVIPKQYSYWDAFLSLFSPYWLKQRSKVFKLSERQ